MTPRKRGEIPTPEEQSEIEVSREETDLKAEETAAIVSALQGQGITAQDMLHTWAKEENEKRKQDEEKGPKILRKLRENVSVLDEALEKDDTKLCFEIVGKIDFLLEFIPPELRSNKEFVLDVVKLHGAALEYVSPVLQNDRDVALAAVRNNSNALKYVS